MEGLKKPTPFPLYALVYFDGKFNRLNHSLVLYQKANIQIKRTYTYTYILK